MMRALGRLILVPLGLLLGALAALGVLLTLGLEATTHAVSSVGDNVDQILVLMDLGFGVISVVAAASIVPALLVVIVGEIGRIRSALYYVLGGGIAMAVIPALAQIGGGAPIATGNARLWTIFATAGFAGGLVYWLVAGRRA